MPISRRSLLKTFAGLSAGAAFQFGGLFRDALAQTATPLRLITITQVHGKTSYWRPRKPNGQLAVHGDSDHTFNFDPDSCLGPMEKHKSSTVVIDGLDFYCCYREGASGAVGHHSAAAAITGADLFSDEDRRSRGPSIDVALASFLKVEPIIFAFYDGVSSWDAAGNKLKTHEEMSKAYPALFGSTMGGGNDERLARARLAGDVSVLKYLKGEANVLRPRLAAAERVKLDIHLDSLNLMEQKLNRPAVMCSKPTAPPSNREDQIPTQVRHKLAMEYIATLMACNYSRVASFHMQAGNSMPWLELGGVTRAIHNDVVHGMNLTNDVSVRYVSRIHRWYAEQVSYLCDLLKAIPEGNGSVYDNTIILWTNELGSGVDHEPWNLPFVLAGGGATWAKNRYLSYAAASASPYVGLREQNAHNRLLVSVLNQFGMNRTSFGDSTITGELTGL